MFDLSKKIAFITGATGDIGSAIARKFHKLGATVVLSGTNEKVLMQLKEELSSNVYCYCLNLSDTAQIMKTCSQIEAEVGVIEILVNNAGITKDGLFMRMRESAWQDVIDINLTAPFTLSREVIKGMIKMRKGRIINISSIVGLAGNHGQVNYSAAKAGVIGMTKSIALEVAGRGITANCVAPGFIKSAMTDKLDDTQKENLVKNIPMLKIGMPDDVAAATSFLASDEASYITGQTIHVNGGMLMV